jgi:predicted DNA-binding protein (MmcQ/YjbR family)
LTSASALGAEELEDLIRQSYELVVANAPKTAKVPKKKDARKKTPSNRRRAK